MSSLIKHRHRLKNKEIKGIFAELSSQLNMVFTEDNTPVETGTIDKYTIILVNNHIDFLIYDNRVFFTLQGLEKYQPQHFFVVVDMGAVRFVVNGADIMGPGVVDADLAINQGDFVWICDEKNHKALAIGIALITGEEMRQKPSGKAVKNIHYVGDKLWQAFK